MVLGTSSTGFGDFLASASALRLRGPSPPEPSSTSASQPLLEYALISCQSFKEDAVTVRTGRILKPPLLVFLPVESTVILSLDQSSCSLLACRLDARQMVTHSEGPFPHLSYAAHRCEDRQTHQAALRVWPDAAFELRGPISRPQTMPSWTAMYETEKHTTANEDVCLSATTFMMETVQTLQGNLYLYCHAHQKQQKGQKGQSLSL